MKKPDADDFVEFDREFRQASQAAGKKQYLIPYFIASHPGSSLDSMIELALFLKRNHYRPDQVQDFIPSPFDIAACMYYTGHRSVHQAAGLHRPASGRSQIAAGPDAVLQTRELFRSPPGPGAGRPAGFDRRGLRCADSRPAAQGRARLRRRRANEEFDSQRSGDHIRGRAGEQAADSRLPATPPNGSAAEPQMSTHRRGTVAAAWQ